MCYKIHQLEKWLYNIIFFKTSKENWVGKDYFDIKECDKLKIKLLELMNN